MADSTIVYVVLVGLVVLFVVDVFPADVVAMSSAVALWATGVLELDQALAGFGNPTVVFVASLLVVAAALDAAGVTRGRARSRSRGGGGRVDDAFGRRCSRTAHGSLITVHGAVASLIPSPSSPRSPSGWQRRSCCSRSRSPAHAGSQLDAVRLAGQHLLLRCRRRRRRGEFGFFEYALVGVPLVAGTVAIVATLGGRLLPDRTPHDRTGRLHRPRDRARRPLHDRRARQGTALRPATPAPPSSSSRHGRADRHDRPAGRARVATRRARRPSPRRRHRTRSDGARRRRRAARARRLAALAERRDADVLVVDSPDDVRRHVVPWGPGARRTVVILPHRRAARHRRRATADRRSARRRRARRDRRAHRGRRLPRHQLDDGRADRGDDPALDRHDLQRRRRRHRRRDHRTRRRRRALPPARCPVRRRCRARPADQQHRDRARRSSRSRSPPPPTSTSRCDRC